MKLFGTILGLTFLAELPDKTALATVMLAARRSHVAVFLGAVAAFVIQSAVAVAFGGVFALLPPWVVHYGAAALFIGLSGKMAFLDEDEEERPAKTLHDPRGPHHHFWPDARAAFVMIFVLEWGDLTQLSTAAFEAKYHEPLIVFSAETLALCAVSALAVLLGRKLKDSLNPRHLRRAGALAFLLVGVALLSGVFG